MSREPALTARLDQHAALVRDLLDDYGVSLHNPEQRRAALAMWSMLERYHAHGNLELGMAVFGEVLSVGG